MMRPITAALAALLLAACGGGDTQPPAAAGEGPHAAEPASYSPVAEAELREGPHPTAVIEVRDLGEIHIELLPELAPKTVANFTELAREGFYDGVTFHRVVPDFMIQAGCPLTKNKDPRDDGKGDPGYTIPDEFTDYDHRRGTVAMANRNYPDTAASQFFIVHQDASELNGRYTVFGRTTSGMAVVDAITELEIDHYGRYGPPDRPYPVEAVIESVRVLPAGGAAVAARADGTAGARR